VKRRKLIGVIISETEELYQHKLMKGIIAESYSLDYDVAIFSTFIKDTGMPEYKLGEKNIYNLINFDHFDGIIVAGRTLALEHLQEEIEELLVKSCKCPVIYIDQESNHYPTIYVEDRKCMEQLTDHLIEVHGYRDIFCLAADPNTQSTINRVAGFQDSLRKHNLPIDESKISYEGNFKYSGGKRLARKIINGDIPKPEVVVCISDYMAIGLVSELEKNGISVPEDIAVTGYDASDEAAICSTVITTYSPPINYTGTKAVCDLTELMTGCRPNVKNIATGRLDIGHSCGCHDFEFMKRSSILRVKRKIDDNRIFLDSYMMEALTAITDFDECIKKFCYYLYLIKDYSDYYLCLCNNWDGSNHHYSDENDIKQVTGYTDKMRLVMSKQNQEYVRSSFFFDTKDMLPDLWKDRDKPKAYYFTPIHFNENTFGYAALSYGDKVRVFDITYRNWSRNLMNVLEFNRVHRKLYRTSFRDVLTGIYNRRGLDQNLSDVLKLIRNQDKKLLVIMADLDNMKSINDNYGHQEGDNVIMVVAVAIQSSCRGNDICARIGGDEFIVVGICDEWNQQSTRIINGVNRYIDNYNKTSGKPYQIQLSLGTYSDFIKQDEDIKLIMDTADHVMYANKAHNKQKRIRN